MIIKCQTAAGPLVDHRRAVLTAYELTDHLGNVRATIDRKRFGLNGEVRMLSYADYYPFGSVMPGRQYSSSNSYRYGYQGQYAENDPETGHSFFPLRTYDGRLARWTATDPYNQFHSPYVGMGNNPISLVDPDGGYVPFGKVWRWVSPWHLTHREWSSVPFHIGHIDTWAELGTSIRDLGLSALAIPIRGLFELGSLGNWSTRSFPAGNYAGNSNINQVINIGGPGFNPAAPNIGPSIQRTASTGSLDEVHTYDWARLRALSGLRFNKIINVQMNYATGAVPSRLSGQLATTGWGSRIGTWNFGNMFQNKFRVRGQLQPNNTGDVYWEYNLSITVNAWQNIAWPARSRLFRRIYGGR